MAEEDRGHDGPSLELPSFGFKRKRRAKADVTDDRPAQPAQQAQQAASEPPVTEPPVSDPPTPEPEPPVTEPEPPASEPTPPAVEPEPTATTRPLYADEAPAPAPPARAGTLAAAMTAPQPAPHPASSAAPSAAPEPDAPTADQQPTEVSEEPGHRRGFSLPAIGGMPASIITGLLVGVITVGLTWASQRLCEVTRGTSSCGGPGFLLLVAILVAMVLLGGALLRAWRVPDPTSTSFLAVGLLAVMTLLFLVDVLFEWWMIIVIPLIAVATFALSHWVTTALVEPGQD